MNFFCATNEPFPCTAPCRLGQISFILFVTLLWGCSPMLQQASTDLTPPVTDPDPHYKLADFLEETNGITLSEIVVEALEQPAADNELEPLANEEIPLPSAEEIISLEADTHTISDKIIQENKPEIKYDFPITINSHVEYFIDKFQNSQQKTFRKWLERSGRYLPMIQAELSKAGLPLDLAYLPMIESGYRLTAYSRAKAVGPWQFMRRTGQAYKLTINNYVDERRDPTKSTKAAIKFLTDLYNEFDSWQLAVAAYNAGGGTIRRAIRKTGSRNFWQIIKGSHLKKETKYYVPKLIAAIMIAKDPESYGFNDIAYDDPLTFATLEVPRWTSMQAVALAGDEPLEDIRNLNRQLRRAITPPGKHLYRIKVPVNKKELIAKNLPRVKATISTKYKTHIIKKGDTVSRICKKYNINQKTLLKSNNLRSSVLIAGKRLRIPFRTTSYKLLDESEIAAGLAPAEMTPENLVIHKIQRGETVSELARRYNVPAHMIAAWNGLEDLSRIRAGHQLAFYLQNSASIATISKRAKSVVEQDSSAENPRLTYYHVVGGDTLWKIAKRFRTTPEKIRRWNNIEGNTIYPGHRLLLKTGDDIDA